MVLDIALKLTKKTDEENKENKVETEAMQKVKKAVTETKSNVEGGDAQCCQVQYLANDL